LRQTVDQRIDAVTRCGQTRFELIALVRQLAHLSCQQRIGPLQFFVAKQQALDTVSNLVNQVRLGHVLGILRVVKACALKFVPVGARGVVHTPQFNGNQEGRAARSARPNLSCPRNGQADEPLGSASVKQATGRLEQATGKATEVVSASPDTGQQGGGACPVQTPLVAQALSGMAVRALVLSFQS
jgi:hypothetical protein